MMLMENIVIASKRNNRGRAEKRQKKKKEEENGQRIKGRGGSCSVSQRSLGKRREYTLDRSPVHHRWYNLFSKLMGNSVSHLNNNPIRHHQRVSIDCSSVKKLQWRNNNGLGVLAARSQHIISAELSSCVEFDNSCVFGRKWLKWVWCISHPSPTSVEPRHCTHPAQLWSY